MLSVMRFKMESKNTVKGFRKDGTQHFRLRWTWSITFNKKSVMARKCHGSQNLDKCLPTIYIIEVQYEHIIFLPWVWQFQSLSEDWREMVLSSKLILFSFIRANLYKHMLLTGIWDDVSYYHFRTLVLPMDSTFLEPEARASSSNCAQQSGGSDNGVSLKENLTAPHNWKIST